MLIKDNSGLTLLEMIVSISLFVVALLSVTQIFILVIEGQRNAIAARNVQENMRYALEVMAKELRNAHLDNGECGADDPVNVDDDLIYDDDNLGNYLKFKNYHHECAQYSLENDAEGIGRIKITRDNNSGYITPNEINVANLKFNTSDGSAQPLVTIKIDIETVGGKVKHKQEMEIQTTISARYY